MTSKPTWVNHFQVFTHVGFFFVAYNRGKANTMIAVVAGTPYYVLMDGKQRIGPKIIPLVSGIECFPIYGFSDKGLYDKFCTSSHLALTPYPLVKGYLQRQTEMPGKGLQLVVVDAVGSGEHLLYAATMEAVLEAQENRTTHVTVTHQLTFDQEADAYRVEEASA